MILDLIALDDSSKVWIYQADRELSYDELDDIREELQTFLMQWTAHAQDLYCYGNVFHRRFLGLFVDESHASASGCSIDASVRFIEQMGAKLGVDFFGRMTYAYLQDDEVKTIDHAAMSDAYGQGQISDETLFFDNLVKTKHDFLKRWILPLSDSWHARFAK